MPIELVIRLLVLFSIQLSGIKEKELDNIRRLLAQNYGYQELATLSNLASAGLVKALDGELDWEEVAERYELMEEQVNLTNPQSYSYVLGGIKPLLIRVIELWLKNEGFEMWLKTNKKCKSSVPFDFL